MGQLKKHKTIEEAIAYVARHPVSIHDAAPINAPVWELVGRALLQVSNNADPRVRGSLGRATRAQKILLDRTVGTRRPGTHPSRLGSEELELVDLTLGAIEE